jgi:glycosyltransferase involved in cell wall biosynthesis
VKNKIHLIYNGIDIQKFRPLNLDIKNLPINFQTISKHILLYTGRLDKEKGIHKVIEILPDLVKSYPDILFLITGEGPFKKNLLKIINNYQINNHVQFLGKIRYDDLVFYYNLCSIFIFPTLRLEGLPYNISEAMACGCIVITSNFGGTSAIISDGITGFLINPYDKKSLIEKVSKILESPLKYEEIKKNARNFALENLSLDKMIRKYLDLFV